MSEQPIRLEFEGTVATLTVDRPKALNALNLATLEAIDRAARDLAHREDVRCVVVTGAGEKAFVAGADIAEMRDFDLERARAFSLIGHSAFAALEALRVPVIAAVNGFALGGGCELALACDFIYAADRAKFGQPEVKLGVTPGFGGTQRLARRVGLAKARELIYTGAMLDATDALRIGLVQAVFPAAELRERVRATALAIASMGPGAVREAKEVLRDGDALKLADANALEVEAFARCFATADQKEGMAAFLEKRPAVFRNA